MSTRSFIPFSRDGLGVSLFGTADPAKFSDPFRADVDFDQSIYSRGLHGPTRRTKDSSIKYTIFIIIISAIIFVTAVSIYDVFRNLINSYFAKLALQDPKSHNKPEDIERSIIANRDSLISSVFFAGFCLIIALIFVPLLLQLLK